MWLYLILLFIGLPWLELSILLAMRRHVGLGPTIGIVLLTGLAGAALAKWQGLGVMNRIHRTLAEGRVPTRELVDGVLILVAGLLLITPGMITDAVGFLLLVPVVRGRLRQHIGARLRRRFAAANSVRVTWGSESTHSPPPRSGADDTIEIEATPVTGNDDR